MKLMAVQWDSPESNFFVGKILGRSGNKGSFTKGLLGHAEVDLFGFCAATDLIPDWPLSVAFPANNYQLQASVLSFAGEIIDLLH